MSASGRDYGNGTSEPNGTVPEATDDFEEEDEFRECPEDLSEFIVVDDTDSAEPEVEQDDLVVLNFANQEDENDDDDDFQMNDGSDEEAEQWDCPPYRKGPRTYRKRDFQPTVTDPRCNDGWPLAPFWPIYVGNFHLPKQYVRDIDCVRAVQQYFASEGLPVFMVYRLKDRFFEDYQIHTGLYDMLVYFCCEQDANLAIERCNQQLYYCHKLHVYSGRTPDFYPVSLNHLGGQSKTWHLKLLETEHRLKTLTELEIEIGRFGLIRCITRTSSDEVLVQFDKLISSRKFIRESRFRVEIMLSPCMKQRFVERDIKTQLQREIDTNSRFMCMRPKSNLLVSIMHGVIPKMRKPWLLNEPQDYEDFRGSENEIEKGSKRTDKAQDPLCGSDWPLASFWPVYIGNFRLFKPFHRDIDCQRAVHLYLASKGIPACMVFRPKDRFYDQYQRHVGFYDMLVYFDCEKDAKRAIQKCNKDIFFGHKLHAYSGRKPIYFVTNAAGGRSKYWRFKHLDTSYRLKNLTSLEAYLGKYGVIRCILKTSCDEVLVQFTKQMTEDKFVTETRFEVEAMESSMMRQRFLEQNVENLLLTLVNTSPKFMNMRTKPHLLLEGFMTKIEKPWLLADHHPKNKSILDGTVNFTTCDVAQEFKTEQTGDIEEPVHHGEDDGFLMEDGSDAENNFDKEEAAQWDCLPNRNEPRTYREEDFDPTIADPRCKTGWPLAVFWPVYVGNFRLFEEYSRDIHCERAVQKFFASKGLPAFMVYRLKDGFFKNYQWGIGFYDMLVYFCCESDANRAIQSCHRQKYFGHKLHVYSGRTPDYFPVNTDPFQVKTWRFRDLRAKSRDSTLTELETDLRRYGAIKCITRTIIEEVFVEFKTPKSVASFADETRFVIEAMKSPMMRQRFIEQDVEEMLQKAIDTSPKFMNSRPIPKILIPIMHGVIPSGPKPWLKPESHPKNKVQWNPTKKVIKPQATVPRQQGHRSGGNPVANMQSLPRDDLMEERYLKQQLSQLYARRQGREPIAGRASQQYAPRTARHHTVEEIDWEFEKERKRRRFQSQFDSSFNSDFFN